MRPPILNEYRPSFVNRLKLLGMRIMFGRSALDAGRAAFYRPKLFARPYYALQQEALRGSSEWSIGERELFAAITATKIQCRFCSATHCTFASAALRQPELVESALENMQPEWANPKLSTVLAFLEKLTQRPWLVTREDIERLRKEGLSDREIEEAALVCVVFSIGARQADAMGFEVPSSAAIRRATPIILRFGYRAYM
jgi:uncharacterized peroxidase-related enzyme